MASNGTLESLRKKYFAGVEVQQSREDYLHELVKNLKIYASAHSLPEPGRPLAKMIGDQLKKAVNGHVKTLGWNRGATVIVWVRNGQFRMIREESSAILLSSSNSRAEQEGIIKREKEFRAGLLAKEQDSTPGGSVLELRPVTGETAVGGYLVFNDSGVVRHEAIGPVNRETRLRVSGSPR
jgi:hypothetical protein